MSEYALACVVCGLVLRNVHNGVDNQPDDGLALTSHGHYGSTAFDPMDGTYLEVNICDECLVKAGNNGQVYVGRDKRPIVANKLLVGYETRNDPLVKWNKGMAGFDDDLEVWEEWLDGNKPDSITFILPTEYIKERISE
jgi:hypothetical protein